MTRHELRHQGETMLRSLFGSTVQPAGLANLLTEAAYGGIWNRPELSLHDRLICSIAALGVGPRLKALRRHIGAGLDHGLTPEAIREILVQASLYSGFSAAEESLALAGEVFAERGIQFPADPSEDASLEELDRTAGACDGGCDPGCVPGASGAAGVVGDAVYTAGASAGDLVPGGQRHRGDRGELPRCGD